MKSIIHLSVSRVLAASYAAVLFAAAGTAWSQSEPRSPVGTWDVLISGGQQIGLAYITFYDDNTFDGQELLAIKPSKRRTDERYLVEVGRTLNSTNGASLSYTNLYGFGEISGPWNYDYRGNVVGYFVQEVGDEESETPKVNPVSFTAKVAPGKRLTLTTSSPNGKITYRGVPYNDALIPDLTGSWYGLHKHGKLATAEFFELYPDATPYVFQINGEGPGYGTVGYSMVSSKNTIGFATLMAPEGSTNYVLRSVVGRFSPRSMKASTKGAEDGPKYISYTAQKLAQ